MSTPSRPWYSVPEKDGTLRLLTCSADGKRAYLCTSDPGGVVSRVADLMEEAQLNAGAITLERGQALLNSPTAGRSELRIGLATVLDILKDVLLVAESRGARLPTSDAEESTDDDVDDGELMP